MISYSNLNSVLGLSTDPRAPNCRGFAWGEGGLVAGVWLDVKTRPDAKYELVRAELIDERAAQGQTVATCVVLDRTGIQVAEPVLLAWPWPDLSASALPGNPNNQHMIVNAYDPIATQGPLALLVGNDLRNPQSDIIGGLGLPFGRHVSYRITWRERIVVAPQPDPDPDPEPDPEPNPEPTDPLASIAYSLAIIRIDTERIADGLDRLAAHLGA